MNGGEEVAGELVVAGCDAPEVLEAAERALDGVAVLVERGREAGFVSAVRFRRDVGRCALRFDLAANLVAVIAFVAMQDLGLFRCLRQQEFGGNAVGNVAAGEDESDRSAEPVGQRVDFRRAAAARTPDRLIFLPPLPPAAERCARTAVESISTCAGGPPACASA